MTWSGSASRVAGVAERFASSALAVASSWFAAAASIRSESNATRKVDMGHLNPDLAPEHFTSLRTTQMDLPLEEIEDMETALSQIARARAKAERYRVEVADLKDHKDGAYKAAAKLAGAQKDIDSLTADKAELQRTVVDLEAKLVAASGATVDSRMKETIKRLQRSDLTQRNTISNMTMDIEALLAEVKELRAVVGNSSASVLKDKIKEVPSWDSRLPKTVKRWDSDSGSTFPTAGSLGLTGA